MVTGAEGAGGAGAGHQAEAEAVAGVLVFFGVGLEVGPEVVGEGVFVRNRTLKDGGQLGLDGGKLGELEIAGFAKPDEEDTLAVLGHDGSGVDDLGVNLVAELLGEGVVDDAVGVTLVVAFEIFDVFEHEGCRLVVLDDVADGKEQIALFFVLEAVFAAKAVFLGNPSETEGLAGEAAAENVVGGDVGDGHGVDVAMGRFAEVGRVSEAGIFVPIAREDAACTGAFKRKAEAAYAAKQVDEAKGRRDLLVERCGHGY